MGKAKEQVVYRPEAIHVGHRTYTVEVMDREKADDTNTWGRHDIAGLRLLVVEHVALPIMAEVLLHEIIHAISDVWNVGLEEDRVERLTNGLATVIRDNPMALQWFQAAFAGAEAD